MKIALIVVGVIVVLMIIAWLRGRKWRVMEKEGQKSLFRALASEYAEKHETLVFTDKAFRTVSDDVYEKASPEKKKKFAKDVAKEREKFKKEFVRFFMDEGMTCEEATKTVEQIVI